LNRKLLAGLATILLLGALLFTPSFQLMLLSAAGYPTAYEGAKAIFYGVRYGDLEYSAAEKHDASLARFDTQLRFDPDGADVWQCNLYGEMTSVFVPDVRSIPPDWVPSEWWRSTLDWRNPRNVYEWRVVDDEGYIHFYRMEEWLTVWFVSISAEWDSGPDFWRLDDEAQNRRYHDAEVWFMFDIRPVWYFEGAEKTYFAIAKIELMHVDVSAEDMAGNEYDPNPSMSFIPESVGSILYIYTSPFGGESAPGEDDFKRYYYRNATLNPQYFRDKVYAYITLADFGTEEWWEGLALKAKGDVVTLAFKVVLFVVGEWKVRDISELPEDYGRHAKIGTWGWTGLSDFLAAAAAWFSNPFNIAGLAMFFWVLVAIIVFAVLTYFLGPPRWLLERLRSKSNVNGSSRLGRRGLCSLLPA